MSNIARPRFDREWFLRRIKVAVMGTLYYTLFATAYVGTVMLLNLESLTITGSTPPLAAKAVAPALVFLAVSLGLAQTAHGRNPS